RRSLWLAGKRRLEGTRRHRAASAERAGTALSRAAGNFRAAGRCGCLRAVRGRSAGRLASDDLRTTDARDAEDDLQGIAAPACAGTPAAVSGARRSAEAAAGTTGRVLHARNSGPVDLGDWHARAGHFDDLSECAGSVRSRPASPLARATRRAAAGTQC